MDDAGVREYFDETAPEYSPGDLKPGAEAKLSWLASSDATTLLDVGCGSGRFLEAALATGAVEAGVGVDLSRGMLRRAGENLQADTNVDADTNADVRVESNGGARTESGRAANADATGTDYWQASATALPVADDAVDAAHLDTVLHHLVGPTRAASKARARRAVEAAARVVRPGGHLVVSEHYMESRLHPRLASHLVFRGLKHAGPVFERLHHQARRGLRACFLTRAEVLALLDGHSPAVLALDPTEEFPATERVVLKRRGRVHVVGTV